MGIIKRVLTGILFLIVFFTIVYLLEKYGPTFKGPLTEYRPLHKKELRTVIRSIYQNHADIRVKVSGEADYYPISLRDSVTFLRGARIKYENFPDDFFKIGDSIIKKPDNDTITIIKDSSVLYFLLPPSS